MDLSDLTAGDEIDLRSIDIDPEDALGISALSMNAVRDSGAVSPARANANGGGKASVKVKSAMTPLSAPYPKQSLSRKFFPLSLFWNGAMNDQKT